MAGMSKIAGQLLWNRVRFTLTGSTPPVPINTGLCQKSYALGTDAGFPGRVMVIPLAPTASWTGVTMSEPYMLNGTVYVNFSYTGEPITLNVLFWAPHTYVGPVTTDAYLDA